MFDVFMVQLKRLLKQPFLIILFTGLTIVFVFFMGGMATGGSVNVPVYSEDLSQEELVEWVDRLNEDEDIVFESSDFETVEEDIRMNRTPFALEIDGDEETYRYLSGRENEHMSAVNQHVYQVFNEYNRLEEVREEFPDSEIEVNEFISVTESQGNGIEQRITEAQLTMIIGMTLYFTIYTILFLQTNLLEEKKKGTWDRLITTPLRKTQIYLGNLLFYYLTGIVQVILSFIALSHLLDVDFGNNYLTIIIIVASFMFTIVSLGILLVSIVKTPQTLQVTIPIVATSMAMLGGAFWPIDLVDNRILVFIGELMPIYHGMNGLVDAITEELTVADLMQPLGILLLMGVLFMGIGINLMERSSQA